MTSTLLALNESASFTPFTATPECASWCVQQHVSNFGNVHASYLFILAAAVLFIYAYEILQAHPDYAAHAPRMVFYAKLCLYIFFFAYFFIVKYQVFYYASQTHFFT